MIFSVQQTQKRIATIACVFVVGLALLVPAGAKKPEATPIKLKDSSSADAHAPSKVKQESMKPASALVMTHEEFETWWAGISSASGKPGFVIEDGLIPVSLQDPILPSESPGLEPMPKIQGSLQWVDYNLKIGDVISIQLLGHPELSQKRLLISPDGAVDLPLIGTIMVAGVSMDEIRHELNRRFGSYLRYPNVSVTLEKVAPIRSYIIGAIQSPGAYSQENLALSSATGIHSANNLDYRLSTLLAKSGGILGNADLAHIKIFNKHKKYRRDANILELLAYGDISQDILLEPEDVVYVPRLPHKQWNSPAILKLLTSSTLGQRTKHDSYLPPSAQEQNHGH